MRSARSTMPIGARKRHSAPVVAGTSAARDAAGLARGEPGRWHSPARERRWSRLMARAQDGDGAAYLCLLEELVPYLRSLAARWHRDHRDVEDTVQDALLTLHAIRHTYDPARPLTPWLAAIAYRRAMDRLRQQKRARARDSALKAECETFAEAPANILETKARERALYQAVADLPAAQRRAVTLLKLEELSLKEAANVSGVSIAALKVAVHRALKNLRKLLGGRGSET